MHPRTLYEYFGYNLENPITAYVSDYHMNVVDVGFLTLEERVKLTSDFRVIAAALSTLYTEEQLTMQEFQGKKVQHAEKTQNVLNAFQASDSIYSVLQKTEGGRYMYKDLFTLAREEGHAEGREEGREEGIQEGEKRGAKKAMDSVIASLMQSYKWTQQQALDFLQGKGEPSSAGGIKSMNLGV